MMPTVHISKAKKTDTKSLPTVHKLKETQANKITFSRSPPNNRMGRVKLCRQGVLDFRLIISHIWAENRAALTSKEEAKNTIPPTAMILVNW